MRRFFALLAWALATAASAQVNGTQNPTDGNGPTPPASTSTDPMAPPRTSHMTTGSRPPAAQNPTDANGPSANANGGNITAPQPTQGAPINTVSGSGTPTTSAPGTDDVSAPSTHTYTPDQVQAKHKRRPHR